MSNPGKRAAKSAREEARATTCRRTSPRCASEPTGDCGSSLSTSRSIAQFIAWNLLASALRVAVEFEGHQLGDRLPPPDKLRPVAVHEHLWQQRARMALLHP